MVSLLLGDDDKRGGKLLTFKCSPNTTLPKDDDVVDGDNKGGKAPRRIRKISSSSYESGRNGGRGRTMIQSKDSNKLVR